MGRIKDLDVTIMNYNYTTGEVVESPEDQLALIVACLHGQVQRCQRLEELMRRYEIGFWLLALVLSIDLAWWLLR